MSAEHNHPPRCCCEADTDPYTAADELIDCPACPEHGVLAPGVECPQCHQLAGRPHTDYCTLAPARVWADMGQVENLEYPGQPGGRVRKADYSRTAVPQSMLDPWTTPLAGNIEVRPACAYPHLNHGDGRGCQDDQCPRHGHPNEGPCQHTVTEYDERGWGTCRLCWQPIPRMP